MKNKEEPYFGWCNVKGCKNEGSSGGCCWRETGYWTVCSKHFLDYKNGMPQPEMQKKYIAREKRRLPDGTMPISFRKYKNKAKDEFIKKVSKIKETGEDEFKAEYNSPELMWEKVLSKRQGYLSRRDNETMRDNSSTMVGLETMPKQRTEPRLLKYLVMPPKGKFVLKKINQLKISIWKH